MTELTRDRGFVLHTRRYRENSRLVEAFTAEHGRIGLIARVSSKHASRDLPALQPCTESLLHWRGRGELQTLDSADPLRFYTLKGEFSVCALYCNELMLYLTDRGVPMHGLYAHYQQAMQLLQEGQPAVRSLRQFEAALLGELGSLPDYCFDAATEQAIEPGSAVWFHPQSGISQEPQVAGSLAITAGQHQLLVDAQYDHTDVAALCRRLFGAQLELLLNGRTLKSRDLLRAYYRYRTPS